MGGQCFRVPLLLFWEVAGSAFIKWILKLVEEETAKLILLLNRVEVEHSFAQAGSITF